MKIIKKIKELNFPNGEYVVVGSGLLEALGIRTASDIDIAASPALVERLRKTGEWKQEYRWNKLFLAKEGIDIITKLDWEDYPTTTAEAIKTATIIDGAPFLNIKETIKFKKALGREKDFKDIALLEKYQSTHLE